MSRQTELRQFTKTRLDIPETETAFDDVIDTFVLSGINRLAPIALKESDVMDVPLLVNESGESFILLSELNIYSVRKAEAKDSFGCYYMVGTSYHHGDKFFVRDLSSDVVALRIYGLELFTINNLPASLDSPVVWFAISEFYDYLAGNKRKYNTYMQNGARSVENMRDEAEFYERKANIYLNDRTTIYGA